MEMIFPVVFALFLFYKPRVSYPSLREKIVEFFSQIRTSGHILLGFSSLLIALSVFLSLSRGGIIFLCISAGFCFFLISLKQGTLRSSGSTLFLLLFLLLISVSWFGWTPIFEEFEKTRNARGEIAENRPVYWQGGLSAFKDFPVTGTGMGTLAEIYPKYQSKATGSRLTHAHNDYVEFLVNGGAVGFLLFFGFMAAIIYKTFMAFRKRREPYAIFLYIGSISGIVAILLHSMTDFNLQIGANGLYMFFLCGLAVSASHTRLRQGLGNTRLQPITAGAKKILVLGAAIMFAFVPLVAWFSIGTIKSESLLNYAIDLWDIENPSERQIEEIVNIGEKAIKHNPMDFFSAWLTAITANQMGDTNKALFYFKKALCRNPVCAPLLQDFGEFMSETGRPEIAERLILAGIKYNRINSKRYKTYAEWLLANGEKARGIDTMRTAILLNVGKSRSYIDFMAENGLGLNEIRGALPDRVEPYIDLAEYLLDRGMQHQAENTYSDAFNYLDKKVEVSPSCFFKASTYFSKQKNYDEALNIMLKGIEYVPDNAKIRIAAAFLYEKVGIPYRATEELKYALILDPKNRRARKKLQELIARQ
jgi:tetratricopeptide (TPR) repeat protein